MKLLQLKYLCEVADCRNNASRAALRLHTSQPNVSRQIMLLEQELGIPLFSRCGRHFSGLTPGGEAVMRRARDILGDIEGIRDSARQTLDADQRCLSVATSHTLACYFLPDILGAFRRQRPDVALHITQGPPRQLQAQLVEGDVDVVISTEPMQINSAFMTQACHIADIVLIEPETSATTQPPQRVSPANLLSRSLITYTSDFTIRQRLEALARTHMMTPDVRASLMDADVIKSCVRMNMGSGIINAMALEPQRDKDLRMTPLPCLGQLTTLVHFHRRTLASAIQRDFIRCLLPHLSGARLAAMEEGEA
ncbi:LysR family transcriptional regulator, cys regulon transcriptional activator [Kushneria avicenniae]|uniref:LysR family transcriptional regulator, cys regulon transcriptional activator n=1 Tax=Kushneria avicenniae TaxID=402385 RepID=A0A1I1LGX8_9GAMM|nr:LysR substrate-binding domain-containing protein [Kushneria avicenniae]SFC72206.1 LysR family transcriptional regulator, cys regulon transcriptional activator [Kushneria avicenniae]